MIRIILLLLCLQTSLLFSQSTRITGTIVAEQESIALGQITLFSTADSTLRKGSYLDSTYFTLPLNANKEKDFYLKISVPTYLDTLISFQITDSVVDLGAITLAKNLDLETVDVVFRKEMFKRTMDGISVNVDGTNLQTLANLFEVLKASPKLVSPDDESIEIIGRGSPLILIDRQAIISNDELKAIPASQIERIEIITNPSAKYKAQGSSNGVIEVFTKDFHLEGYNITARAEGGINTQLQPSAGMHLGLSLKKKKFSMNGYLGGSYRQTYGLSEATGFTTDDSNRGLSSFSDNFNTNLWQYYSIKTAYKINDKQKISLGLNGYGGGGVSSDNATTEYLTNNEVTTRSTAFSERSWKWLNNTSFLNYTIETDTNNSNLEINLNYVNKVSANDDETNSQFEYLESGAESVFDIRNESRDIPQIGELRIVYEHVFDTTGWKLSGGGSYSLLINGKRFDRFNNADGEWIIDEVFSNSYDYKENNGAAFFEVSKKWDKIGIRAGLRAEYTSLNGYSNSLEQQFIDSSYILPFPSASILFEPNEKLGITVFYDAGINRPQFSSYDPFIRKQDSLSIEYGNPYLRPSKEHSVGLDFDLFYAYNISVSYSYNDAPISSISFVDDASFLTESTPWNAESEQGLSASFSIPLKTDWLQGWNSIWVDYSKYSFSPIFGREDFFNLTYGVYSYLTFILPRDFNIMNRVHINKWGGADSEMNANFNWGMRFTKKYNGNKFKIFVDVGNIIPPKRKRTVYSGNFQYSSVFQNQFTTFKLGLFYKFGRLKTDAQIKESTSGQSDRL
ncbi:MAG: outer membrane beta-barrel protein [Crocinitomix sp.]|nr:outer membrane beta-barrel protein [Crocinitomix sp.]